MLVIYKKQVDNKEILYLKCGCKLYQKYNSAKNKFEPPNFQLIDLQLIKNQIYTKFEPAKNKK